MFSAHWLDPIIWYNQSNDELHFNLGNLVDQDPGWKPNIMQLIILNIYTVLFVLHFSECVKISTYNLWNVMFNWDIRKYRVAEMVIILNLTTALHT